MSLPGLQTFRARILRLARPLFFIGLALCFAAAAFAAPAADTKPAKDKKDAKEAQASPFAQAEALYQAGKFGDAKSVFLNLLQSGARGPHIEQTVFRLGQIDLNDRLYVTALRYFDLLLEKYPNTSLLDQTLFLQGVCYFEMERFDKAAEKFSQQFKANTDPKVKFESLLYLGRIDEKNAAYDAAFAKIRQVHAESGDKELRAQAEKVAAGIVNDKLSRNDLELLSRKLQTGFPVDLLLARLIFIYRAERDNENYTAVLRKFIDLFPDNPKKSLYEMMLSQTRNDKLKEYKVAAFLPLTGKYALTGQQVLQGAQLAFNLARREPGEPVELVVKDSSKSDAPPPAMIEELAMDPNVLGVVGPVLSAVVKEITPLAREYQLPVFTPTATAADLSAPGVCIFRNALTKDIQGKFLAEHAVNELGLRRFVIFYPKEPYGEEMKNIFTNEVRSLGAEIVAAIGFERGQSDFKSLILEIGGMPDSELKKLTATQLARMREKETTALSKPVMETRESSKHDGEVLQVYLELGYDAIFIPATYDKISLIAPQLAYYNIDRVTLLGTSVWNHPELVRSAGRFLQNKSVFIDGFFLESREQRVADFVRAFKSTFGADPTIISAQAFDAARMYIKVIREGAHNRQEVKNALLALRNFPGVSGETAIQPSCDAEKKLFPLKIRANKIVEAD